MTGSSEIRVFPTAVRAASAAADLLAELAHEGGHVALAGGSTPAEAYKMAARKARDWRDVVLWMGDDRCVPADHEHSNFAMVRRTLLETLPADGRPEVHPIKGDLGPDAAADDYENLLREHLGDRPELDLILLGLGPDAHTASLFPGKPAVQEDVRLAVPVPEPGLPPHVPRVSLTFPVINAAAHVVFLVAGGDKAEAMVRAFGTPRDPAAPAAHVRPARLTVLCDEAAATKLGQVRA